MPPEDTDDVRLDQDSILLSQGSADAITVTWDPLSILPIMDASLYTVDIALYRLYTNPDGVPGGEYRPFLNILRDAPNNGIAVFPVPSNDELVPEVYPVSVRISVGSRTDFETSEEPSIIDGVGRSSTLSGLVAQWTSTLYYSVSMRLEARCVRWCARQETGIGERIRNRLPACPPRVDQARTQNSGLKEDSGFWTVRTNRFFHPEADTCFRQRNIAP